MAPVRPQVSSLDFKADLVNGFETAKLLDTFSTTMPTAKPLVDFDFDFD